VPWRDGVNEARGDAGPVEGGLQYEVVLLDENYTVNDDLKACGLPGDDEDDLSAVCDSVGSFVALIIVDAGASAGVSVSATTTPMLGSTPSSKPSASTGTSSRSRRRSVVWNDFEEVFEDGPNAKKVGISAKSLHCCHVLIGCSSYGTGHFLQH
jgi:hypothetical protein